MKLSSHKKPPLGSQFSLIATFWLLFSKNKFISRHDEDDTSIVSYFIQAGKVNELVVSFRYHCGPKLIPNFFLYSGAQQFAFGLLFGGVKQCSSLNNVHNDVPIVKNNYHYLWVLDFRKRNE